MDVLNVEKLFATKYCYKRSQQLLYNLSLHSLIIFIFSFWLSSQSIPFPPYALPSMITMVVTPPPIFSPRCLFVVVNVIVLYIVGEQKLVSAKLSSVNRIDEEYYVERMEEMHHMIIRCDNVTQLIEKVVEEKEEKVIGSVVGLDRADGNGRKKEAVDEEKDEDEDDYDYDCALANKEFNRRAEAFIARVNKQRKLEAVDCFQYW